MVFSPRREFELLNSIATAKSQELLKWTGNPLNCELWAFVEPGTECYGLTVKCLHRLVYLNTRSSAHGSGFGGCRMLGRCKEVNSPSLKLLPSWNHLLFCPPYLSELYPLWELALLILHNLESPVKGISMRDCLHSGGLWTCLWVNVFIKFIDVGRPSPLWAEPLPRQRVLPCIKVEKSRWAQAKRASEYV